MTHLHLNFLTNKMYCTTKFNDKTAYLLMVDPLLVEEAYLSAEYQWVLDLSKKARHYLYFKFYCEEPPIVASKLMVNQQKLLILIV